MASKVLSKSGTKVSLQKQADPNLPPTNLTRFPISLTLVPVFLLALIMRLLTVPSFLESQDSIAFAKGVAQYSVVQSRPYWPGYPVYIWCGKLINLIVQNPTLALHLVSVLVSSFCVFPLAAITSHWRHQLGGSPAQARQAGFAAALLWVFTPLALIDGSEIFSDPLALLFGLIVLWLCGQALASKTGDKWLVAAAITFGLLLGIRLGYAWLIIVLAYVTWQKRTVMFSFKGKPFAPLPVLVLAALIISINLWLGWQLSVDGLTWFSAANNILDGHFTVWGGSIGTDQNFLTRPLRLLQVWLVYGLGGWLPDAPLTRLPTTIIMLVLLIAGTVRLLKTTKAYPHLLITLWTVSYLLWALLSFDVDLARYSFPLVAIACMVAALGLPPLTRWGYAIILIATVALATVSVPLALAHQSNPPIGIQLTTFANQNLNSPQNVILIQQQADVYRLFLFILDLSPQVATISVNPTEVTSQADRLQQQGRIVYLLWLPQNADPRWQPVAHFSRYPYLESRGSLEIWLYKY